MSLLRLPEYLNRDQVISDMDTWSVNNHIFLNTWDPDEFWNRTPISYIVHIKVFNFPLEFWHPDYFKLLVAGFGMLLYVDEANTRGFDRSTLRMAIRVYDPLIIPQEIIFHRDEQWTRCQVSILIWSMGFDTPDDFDGPNSGGSHEEVHWMAGVHRYQQDGDVAERASLMQSHCSILRTPPPRGSPGSTVGLCRAKYFFGSWGAAKARVQEEKSG